MSDGVEIFRVARICLIGHAGHLKYGRLGAGGIGCHQHLADLKSMFEPEPHLRRGRIVIDHAAFDIDGGAPHDQDIGAGFELAGEVGRRGFGRVGVAVIAFDPAGPEQPTAMVEQLKKQVDQETEMLVATTAAKTKNEVASINASATLKAAELNLLKAVTQAKITQVQGEAKVQAGFVVDNERALGEKLRVAVFKDSSTLADLTFVDKLNEGLSIKILHAGPGTLWTDMKGLTPTVPVKTAK